MSVATAVLAPVEATRAERDKDPKNQGTKINKINKNKIKHNKKK